MKIKQDRKLARRVIGLLNYMFRRDPVATERLVGFRVLCNPSLAGHPTIQVMSRHRVGMLGVLNGLCGTISRGKYRGWGMVCSVHDDETDRLRGFGWTEKPDGGLPRKGRKTVAFQAATARHPLVRR